MALRTACALALLAASLLAGCASGSGSSESEAAIEDLRVAVDGAAATLTARVSAGDAAPTSVVVDWGDGNREELEPAEDLRADHDYATPGTYTVKLEVAAGDATAADATVASVGAARVEASETPTPTATATETTTPTETAAATATATAAATTPPPTRTPAPTASPTPTKTPTSTPSPSPSPTATATASPTPTEPPNTAPVVVVTSATTNQSLDATVVFTIDDAEGGAIAITVDYGDGMRESTSGPNGEYTATHAYDHGGAYQVTITAVDPEGAAGGGAASVAAYEQIRVTLVEAQLSAPSSCDTFSSESEFFGTVSALGQSKNYAVSVAEGGTSTLSFGPSKTYLIGPGDSDGFTVSISVTEDDAGLEGADDPVGSFTSQGWGVYTGIVSRGSPTFDIGTKSHTIGSSSGCQAIFRYRAIWTLLNG